jgi:hypothetical protein
MERSARQQQIQLTSLEVQAINQPSLRESCEEELQKKHKFCAVPLYSPFYTVQEHASPEQVKRWPSASQ